MYSEYSRHSNYINVPYRLPKHWKDDNSAWDLLVLAICLKLNSTSSGMYVRKPYDLMKIFHCGYRKAARLFERIKKSKLFFYNPRTKFLVARTFKIGAKCVYTKRGFKYYHDEVIAIEKAADGTISHKDISRQLRDKLMIRMLSAKASSDEFQRCCNNLCPETRKPLTHKYLANVAGVSRSTATRHLNKLSKGENKLFDVTTHAKIPVYDLEHGIVLNDKFKDRRPFISGRFAYIRDVNEYTFVSKNHHAPFKHIIYNHPDRRTNNRVLRFPWEL